MKTFDPNKISQPELYGHLTGAVAPRPIGFVSSLSREGIQNLAPFSYFNVISIKPPMLMFAPCRSGRTNTTKNTLDNVYEVDEVVVNVVSESIVEQMSLTSAEYDREINEFTKSGLTPVASHRVQPARVKESPIQFECSVERILPLGNIGGSGTIVACKILLIHIDEAILNSHGKIDPHLVRLVSRMGGSYYSKAFDEAVFEVARPSGPDCIGYDGLPAHIKHSKVLSGNELGQLANKTKVNSNETLLIQENLVVQGLLQLTDISERRHRLHQHAKQLLQLGQRDMAWQVLMLPEAQ